LYHAIKANIEVWLRGTTRRQGETVDIQHAISVSLWGKWVS